MTTRLTVLTMALSVTTGIALAQDATEGKPDLRALVDEPVLQPGNDSGAAELRTSLEPYLTKEAFESGVVSIEPVDEGYSLDFDLQALVDSFLEAEDISLKVSDYSVLISEQPNGQWFVSSSGPLSFSYATDTPPEATIDATFPQSIDYEIETMDWAGYYDPDIATYTKFEAYLGKTRQVQTSAEGTVTTTTEPIRMRFTGSPGVNGTADVEVLQFGGASRQEMQIPLDPADPQANIPIVIASGTTEGVTIGRNLKSADMLRLYSVGIELIQNPEREGLLEDVKAALEGALPLWDNLAAEVKIAGFNVDVGTFGSGRVGSLDFDMDFDGISDSGHYTIVYDLSDISVTSPFVPEWANALIPTQMRFGLDASNIDLAEPAAILISDLRLDSDEPIPDETVEEIRELFRTSQAKLGLGNSTVTGHDYRVDYSAEFEDGDVAVEVEAEGIDAVIARLQEASQQYPEALQGVSFLQIAKGFGKPTGEDTLEWNVDIASDGSITVNGAMLKRPDPQPLPDSGNEQLDLDAPPPSGQPSDPL
ncbi:hypothetical protein [Fulvimarina sp. MAC8]|uniref:hypothetical protein n=1 Tax=Fulvimarina sp. MAC8 TaxID=3162874 RepID=UPI0032EE9047